MRMLKIVYEHKFMIESIVCTNREDSHPSLLNFTVDSFIFTLDESFNTFAGRYGLNILKHNFVS